MDIPKFLLSSTGEGVAMRWKAVASAAVPIVLLVSPLLGLDLGQESLNEFVGGVSNAILAVWAAGSAVGFVAGWIRRNFNKANKLGAFKE